MSPELSHYVAGYDPAYAHAYYLRTRKLKGRHKGPAAPAASFSPRAQLSTSSHSVSVKLPNGKTLKLNPQQLHEAVTHATQRINQLKQTEAKLVSQLQKATAKQNTSAKGSQPPTAASKAKAKQTAKNYRQSHRQQLKNKAKAAPSTSTKAPTTSKTDPVAALQGKLSRVRGALAVAVALQKSLASATKNG